jgi:hypothetical protein
MRGVLVNLRGVGYLCGDPLQCDTVFQLLLKIRRALSTCSNKRNRSRPLTRVRRERPVWLRRKPAPTRQVDGLRERASREGGRIDEFDIANIQSYRLIILKNCRTPDDLKYGAAKLYIMLRPLDAVSIVIPTVRTEPK